MFFVVPFLQIDSLPSMHQTDHLLCVDCQMSNVTFPSYLTITITQTAIAYYIVSLQFYSLIYY